MSDVQLGGKFTGLADGILPADRALRLMDLCWQAWDLDDAGKIAHTGATH